MPAKSEAQQRLMGMALAAKKRKGHYGNKIQEIADSMSEQQLRDFAKTKHESLPEKKATLHPKKEKTLLYHLLKRAGLAENISSTSVFPGSEIGKVQPIGEAREKTPLTPVPTQSVGTQAKQPSIVLPQSSKNMSKDQSHIAAREAGAPLHTKEPTQSFSKLPDGNIAKPFSKMKQGSINYSRNTGVADVDGEVYVNGNDVELLGKLGFEYSEGEYLGLEKTSEVLDVYSYIEKVAGVPKEVTKLIDDKKAFSAEYLKGMGYTVPKGYEVKGDLVCPVEKIEQSFQQTRKEEKGSSEKTASEKPGLWANIRAKRARGEKAAKPGDGDYPDRKQWKKLTKAAVAAWQRSEGKNPEGGLNAKGRASYKKETGGTLKAPVTESNPSGERAGRQKSFCSRMCGMKSKNTGAKGQSDPDSRINKSLRKWNCKCGEDHSTFFEKVSCLIKAAAPTQHYEGESIRPFGGVAGGMGGGVGLQQQSNTGINQPALKATPLQLRPVPAQEAPRPVNPAPGSPAGVTNTAFTMSQGTGQMTSNHEPLNVNNVPLGQTNAPSWNDVYSKMKTRPGDFLPDGIVAGLGAVANRVIPGAGLSADLLNKVRRGQAMAQIGVGETSARGKNDDPTGAMIDRIGALGGAAAVYPHPYARAIGYGMQAGSMGLNLARDYDQARAQFPDTLTEQPVVPSSNYPASNFSIRPEQQAQPSVNTGGDLLAKKGMQAQTYKFEGNVQGVHLRKELHNILDKMRRAGLAVNHPETNEVYATLEGRKKYTDAILNKLKKALSERKERPLAYGSDYNISHVPSMQEKLKPVKFTKEHLLAFVKRNAEIKSLQNKAEKDQFDFVGKRYRLKPNQHGELEGMVPGKAYDQLINGAPSYSFQIHPQADILGKQAASIGSLGRLGKALGVKGYGKVMDVARGAFDNFSSLGKSVPPGALHTERMNALNTGNKLLEDFKPDGFKIYSGRVKTPDSLAGHGNQVTNDLLGFRVTPKNGYGEESANALADQLRQQGINVTKQKKLVRDGYHGWNIAGEMPGASGNVPVEFQMTPRRMQGVFAADHMYNYKPETSGVNPAVSKYIYKPAINYLTKTMSPMSPIQTRVGYGAAGLTGVGGLGAGAYSLTHPGKAAPGVTSARPMAQPNTQPIAMGGPQVNVDTL